MLFLPALPSESLPDELGGEGVQSELTSSSEEMTSCKAKYSLASRSLTFLSDAGNANDPSP